MICFRLLKQIPGIRLVGGDLKQILGPSWELTKK